MPSEERVGLATASVVLVYGRSLRYLLANPLVCCTLVDTICMPCFSLGLNGAAASLDRSVDFPILAEFVRSSIAVSMGMLHLSLAFPEFHLHLQML